MSIKHIPHSARAQQQRCRICGLAYVAQQPSPAAVPCRHHWHTLRCSRCRRALLRNQGHGVQGNYAETDILSALRRHARWASAAATDTHNACCNRASSSVVSMPGIRGTANACCNAESYRAALAWMPRALLLRERRRQGRTKKSSKNTTAPPTTARPTGDCNQSWAWDNILEALD